MIFYVEPNKSIAYRWLAHFVMNVRFQKFHLALMCDAPACSQASINRILYAGGRDTTMHFGSILGHQFLHYSFLTQHMQKNQVKLIKTDKEIEN